MGFALPFLPPLHAASLEEKRRRRDGGRRRAVAFLRTWAGPPGSAAADAGSAGSRPAAAGRGPRGRAWPRAGRVGLRAGGRGSGVGAHGSRSLRSSAPEKKAPVRAESLRDAERFGCGHQTDASRTRNDFLPLLTRHGYEPLTFDVRRSVVCYGSPEPANAPHGRIQIFVYIIKADPHRWQERRDCSVASEDKPSWSTCWIWGCSVPLCMHSPSENLLLAENWPFKHSC